MNEAFRGVQYVHLVMRKCIMVKVGGKRNTHKVCKKEVIFSKTEGKFVKVGGNKKNCETGGNVQKQGKQGEIRNLWSMTKKRKKGHQKFLQMKIEKFKIFKIFDKV